MKVELIPIIEITYYNQLPSPEKGPYWEYEDEWENHANARFKKAGFKDEFESFRKGSSFYEPKKITLPNLKKLVVDWFEEYNGIHIDQICPLFGGYVLRIDDQDVYYPQCCGDLGDIVYWRKMINEGVGSFYNGHPSPILEFGENDVTFIFDERDECFVPPVPKSIKIDIQDLKKALIEAELNLIEFKNSVTIIENDLDFDLRGLSLAEILIYRNLEINT